MLHKTFGIVLHSLKYSDSSNIVDIYTQSFGRMSFIVPAGRSQRSAFKAVWQQPLTILDLDISIRPNTRLQRVKDLRCATPLVSVPYHPYKTAIALFLAEFLSKAIREETENQPLFDYLYHSIRWLDTCEQSFANFHLVFLMRLSRFLGLYPNLDNYQQGDYFDMEQGTFSPTRPVTHASYMNKEESEKLRTFVRMNYETMHLFGMSRAERNRCVDLITHYYRLHLPGFGELKSLNVLKELFA